jgi:NADH-quinone oxidoreductase subunit G
VGGAGLAKGALEPALAISNRLGFVRTLEDGTEWNGFNVLHGGKPYGP